MGNVQDATSQTVEKYTFLQSIDAVAPGEHVTQLGEEQIKEMATIYKKESKRPLTNYQKSVNEAAIELCLQHPGLLHTRKNLARAKVIEDGYQRKITIQERWRSK